MCSAARQLLKYQLRATAEQQSRQMTERLSLTYIELSDLLVLGSLLVDLAGSGKVQGLMHGQVGNVLIILVHQTSSSLDDKVFLVFAIVLYVTSHSAEGCVLEVASQQLKKNGLAGAWWSHKKGGATLYAQNSEKESRCTKEKCEAVFAVHSSGDTLRELHTQCSSTVQAAAFTTLGNSVYHCMQAQPVMHKAQSLRLTGHVSHSEKSYFSNEKKTKS